ncbi:16S rRNA (uracil(1498)-N(3))-methyltransferase [Desulfurivibrio sp. D14AmB]|uniref:16S rRNA (uracil(1498)-N(3))-methyltransferase n=1 Tax=Desulfurivibrio sp. D14AmB TaxID=3374370 RepID=UPI00376EECF1
MNIILIHPGEAEGDRVILRDHRARHIHKILKSKTGDTLRVGLLDGPMGTGLILGLAPGQVELQLDCRTPPPTKAATDLILALPRPIMLKRVLAQATAMGVSQIHLLNANRVEKSFWQSSLLAPEALTAALQQGLEQAVDTRLPTLTLHHRFRPFVEDRLPSLTPEYPLRLLAHPGPEPSPRPTPTTPQRRLLAIGPEGGWVDYEVDCFRQLDFKLFSLGSRILRVDTAVPALLAATRG